MSKTFKDDLELVLQNSEFLDSFMKHLGMQTVAGRNFLVYSIANALLFDRKQQDYGPKNISSFGTFGVVVRMNDKHERLKSLFGKGRKKRAQNESILDSLRDIGNYAVIAQMLERGEWPNE